ncbi:MAG TPA: PqqD family protein [Bacteroidota bacterium]|nr:PqqD family protein [Bacteroidota bacterium]
MFGTRRKRKSVNLLELTPSQRVPWEMGDGGSVVVLIPKFSHPVMVRWLVPHLKYPNVRVTLDTLGSSVWKMCDGRTTVAEMTQKIQAESGDTASSAQERVHKFLLMLEKSELINLIAPPSVQQR